MTTEVRHWFYPVKPRGKYCLEDTETGKRIEISPENLLRNAEKRRGSDETWHLASGFRMMKQDDLIWIYVSGNQEICALASVRDVIKQDEGWEVRLAWNAPATRALNATPLTRIGIGNQHIQSVVPANANAVPLLKRWLMQHRQEGEVEGDVPASEEEASDLVMASIRRRQGQAAFRSSLLDAYGFACAVTRETAEAVLEAAHIVPYNGTETNKTSNGLLLRSDLHTLFDLNLIAVDSKGALVVSVELNGSSYAALAGTMVFRPKAKAKRASSAALSAHHRKLRN